MEIMFLGPLGKVTGSCCWMRDVARGWSFLVDCGMQQGESTAAEWNDCHWPFEPAELDFVVLTHAHIDHSGLLPVLYARGFTGPVYATRETREVATVLLLDAARFPGAKFSEDDVSSIAWKEPVKPPLLGGFHPVATDLFLRFFRSGHVIGATSVAVYWGDKERDQKSIVFSGDVGPNTEDSESLPFIRHRMGPGDCDFAVLESTYGGVVRSLEDSSPVHRRKRLKGWLDHAIDNNGVLAIPAFALGRTQDVLFDLHWIVAESPERYGSVRFFLDSTTATKLNKIVLGAMERTESNGKGKVRPLWMGKQMCAWFGLDSLDPEHLTYARHLIAQALGEKTTALPVPAALNDVGRAWRPLFSKVTNRVDLYEKGLNGPTVMVFGSGTGDGGAASYWLPRILKDARNSVVFAGYCTPMSTGGQLQELGGLPTNERRLFTGSLEWQQGKYKEKLMRADVTAEIDRLVGYSAHADQSGLVSWAINSRNGRPNPAGRTIFLQHGSNDQRDGLKAALATAADREGCSIEVICPSGEPVWLDLDRGAKEVSRGYEEERIQAEIRGLEARLRDMRRD